MSKNIATIISVVTGFIILWLLIDRKGQKLKILELETEIEEHKSLNRMIKQRLKELITNNQDIDTEIASELTRIAALIEIKQDAKAILSLVKIIETLLHKLYGSDDRLKSIAIKNERSRPAFMDYLELALDDKAITKEDYHLITVAKIVRDEEAHQLNVEKEKGKILSSFISGIGIVLALCRMVKTKFKTS